MLAPLPGTARTVSHQISCPSEYLRTYLRLEYRPPRVAVAGGACTAQRRDSAGRTAVAFGARSLGPRQNQDSPPDGGAGDSLPRSRLAGGGATCGGTRDGAGARDGGPPDEDPGE